jgi:cytochrome c peroxidase
VFFLAFALVLSTTPAASGQNVVTNGSASGITIPNFLFEPEVPFASLKTAPTWNEIEQLLDNPYAVALCSTLTPAQVPPNPVGSLLRGTPGTDQGYPSYCSTILRRGSELLGGVNGTVFGVKLPPLLVDPLNYNPTTGEEMRLLNINYPGGSFFVPNTLDLVDPNAAGGAGKYVWSYRQVQVSSGARVGTEEAAIDYNAPIAPDAATVGDLQAICITTTEASPAEGAILCGGDPGDPGYAGFGVNNPAGYSTPAVPGGTGSSFLPNPNGPKGSVIGLPLYDAARGGNIVARDASGHGGLRKPSLRVPENTGGNGSPTNPFYLINAFTNFNPGDNPETLAAHVTPSNENDYVRNRLEAMTLGKALFWDMQVGSDSVQACGTCHFNGTGTDTRTKNQVNPNHIGGDNTFQIRGGAAPNTYDLVASDFPLHKLANPDVAGDPACASAITAHVNGGILENMPNAATGATGSVATGVDMTVCDAGNIVGDVNDVVSSMGVHFGKFKDVQLGLLPNASGVATVAPDTRWTDAEAAALFALDNQPNVDPIAGFQGSDPSSPGHGIRRVEPRNTPTMQAAGFNFDNFWDGRARHDFNGGSVFGAADPQSHVWVDQGTGLTATRQVIRFASIASLATGPGLSEFEMSRQGRNWAKQGKRLLQGTLAPSSTSVTPLANQLVDPTDSLLGRYSNQGGSQCAALGRATAAGKPGLCVTYQEMIQRAFYPALWQNTTQGLSGCYTDTVNHPTGPFCPASVNFADGFDGYVLTPLGAAADPANTNQFTQMEANFSLFWGLGIKTWVDILVPDNTPFDQFLDLNPDAFASLGEPGEPGLVANLPNCTTATQRNCFRPVGNFRRDNNLTAAQCAPLTLAQCRGNRPGNSITAPDPLLGLDIFFASNLSNKNTNFRTGRCGECHAVPTLTDNTVPFTFKGQLRDFVAEFSSPGVELVVEPLGRLRTISGFLLESEFNENGQDGVERRIANQSIVPCPTDGLAYPGGMEPGTGQGFGPCSGAAASFFDNGVYNLGVRPIAEDIGRGGDDAFGWPLSLAALMMKNIGGAAFQPSTGFGAQQVLPVDPTSTATLSATFEISAQDQQINPGIGGTPLNPQLPAYLAPWVNEISVGDAAPELDESGGAPGGMLNTLTNIAMLEGFLDTLGPFNPAGINNESLNMGDVTLMGTWPVANRVGRMGSFKAPQLRNVELTGPYFHNGGKLTLRQVVDFYTRGGDFPITNAEHRDFNMVNMNVEVQSNLSEPEKVALVDFLLELTDERNRHDRAPFDHPEVLVPQDGTAPENTFGRPGFVARLSGTCTDAANVVIPGATGPCFQQAPAVGANGMATPEPAFLNIVGVGGAADPLGRARQRLVGAAAFCGANVTSQYCH